ncbi:hypothetical protein K4F52_002651 [Lecanicillium sp. MT-2017a]|nr:hypothetical protein K4F52_002651 [Lecanicillium sp. MT-2017a]
MRLQHSGLLSLALSLLPVTVVGQVIVTGVDVASRNSSVPERRNILELSSEKGAQWDLYIRSLQAMHEQREDDPLSYFQIAGIHGRPFIEYDNTGRGVGGWQSWGGYCPHGEQLFLPWHRPYVALYEQTLVENAKRIAQEYPEEYRDTYTEAAEILRAPFWDWAADNTVPPDTVPATITVNVPDGQSLKSETIDNPLYTYKFPLAVLNGEFGYFDNQYRSQVYHCSAPNSYPASANRRMANRNYRQWTYDVLTKPRSFASFSTVQNGGLSLEQIHNDIHWDGACGEQFLDAGYSGFDPLFMLHHANVDRIWAYWQVLRPQLGSMSQYYRGGSRFATQGGTIITPQSPLPPFRQSESAFHTPESIASIETLGYSYPALGGSKTAQQTRDDVSRLINRLYGPRNGRPRSLGRRDDTVTRYFAKISVDVTELERPCSIDVVVNGTHAGSMTVMTQPSEGLIHGEVPLDAALESSHANQLAVNDAVKSVQTAVNVEITKADGTRIATTDVPSLDVSLEHVQVAMPHSDTELPEFSDSRVQTLQKGGKPDVQDPTTKE